MMKVKGDKKEREGEGKEWMSKEKERLKSNVEENEGHECHQELRRIQHTQINKQLKSWVFFDVISICVNCLLVMILLNIKHISNS